MEFDYNIEETEEEKLIEEEEWEDWNNILDDESKTSQDIERAFKK